MKSKLGLVLEGGGAKGAYHLGVYKALLELGYHFDGIAGTSIGAINGALIVQGDWKKAYDLWFNASNKNAFGIDEDVFKSIKHGHLSHENASYAAKVISDTIKGKGIDVKSMKNLFSSIFNENKIRRSKMELGIVTVQLPEFKSVEIFKDQIENGKLFSFLLASANFPLFQPEHNLEGSYIDGGLRNNLPINMLPSRGINKIIAVRTFALGVTKKYNNPEVDITYIEPSKHLGPMLDFSNEKTRFALNLGYHDTYRTLKGYIGSDYCIKPLAEDFVYIEKMLKTADDKIIRAAKVMGYKNINPKRFMFEHLFPQIADYLNLGLNTSYEVLIITFFEEIAKTLLVDRNRIYKADVFIETVQRQFFVEHRNINKYKQLPKIVQSSSFLSSFVKNDFFYFIMDIFLK